MIARLRPTLALAWLLAAVLVAALPARAGDALVWSVLSEMLDLPGVRLHDGSLAEWAKEDTDMYDSTDGMGGVIGG